MTTTLLLSSAYMLAEVIGGWWTGSLALMADAGHMLSDVASLGLSLFAAWVSERPATSKRTYGFYRAEILAALFNGSTLVAVSIWICVEAYHRLWSPHEVSGGEAALIATGGLIVNLVSLRILGHGGTENLNIRGAWLHVLTDALGSVGAILGAAAVWAFDWRWADPAASILIALLVIYSAWHLLAESVSVLMESAPSGIDVDEVLQAMREVQGVHAVHDLHIWSIASGRVCLSAHVVAGPKEQSQLLKRVRDVLHDRFGIDHLTIQIEPENFEDCETNCMP